MPLLSFLKRKKKGKKDRAKDKDHHTEPQATGGISEDQEAKLSEVDDIDSDHVFVARESLAKGPLPAPFHQSEPGEGGNYEDQRVQPANDIGVDDVHTDSQAKALLPGPFHQSEAGGGNSEAQGAQSADDIDVDDLYTESLAKGSLPIPFRILILGRANAGKTTILERITGGPEADAYVFRNGKLLEEQEVKGQADRGLHNVEDEIIFPSRPGFIFHDSRGFEAGSRDELRKVRQFVEASSKTTNLHKQLHAIWMCLPLDEPRDLFKSEKEALGWSRGHTPLVVIFTKRDGAITKFQKEVIANAPQGTTINCSFKKEARHQAEIKVNIYPGAGGDLETQDFRQPRSSDHCVSDNQQYGGSYH